MNPRARQTGIALITALLVTAIATVAAVEIISRQHLDIRRSQNTLARNQALDYLVSAEAFVLVSLKSDLKEQRGSGGAQVDSYNESWHKPLISDFEGAKLTGRTWDLQGRFNLNNLLTLAGKPTSTWPQNPSYRGFKRLLEALKERDSELRFDSQALIEALVDWMDPDVDPNGNGGAEDGFYLGLTPPYRTANRMLASVSELRLIRGFRPEDTPGLVKRLEDEGLLAALPSTDVKLNVNTAQPEVLAAMVEGLDATLAKQLLEKAAESPWTSVKEFIDQSPAKAAGSSGGLGISSQYFLLDASVHLDPAVARLQSVIHRGQDHSLKVISRSRNTL